MNRGRHPLIWAKVLGLKKSGTTFFMDEGVDTGDVLDQKEFEIIPEDTAADLYQKMIITLKPRLNISIKINKRGLFKNKAKNR